MIPSFTIIGKIKTLIASSIVAFFLLSGIQIKAQTPEAEKNFQACKVCHNISGPKLIGPTLGGILDRRDKAWIYRFVRNSTEVIESGDAYAVKLFEENNKIRLYLWAHEQDFVVILQKLGRRDAYLVTSFYIKYAKKRADFKKRHADYMNKKNKRLNGCEWF